MQTTFGKFYSQCTLPPPSIVPCSLQEMARRCRHRTVCLVLTIEGNADVSMLQKGNSWLADRREWSMELSYIDLQNEYIFGVKAAPCSAHIIKSTDSVTRLGDLLDFGALFKAFSNNLLGLTKDM